MGWQEARQRYDSGQTLTKQTVEDLVARRVLRGLNVPVRVINYVEKAIFATAYPDEALWPRTKRLLQYALATRRMGDSDIEVYEIHSDKDILQRFTLTADIHWPIFLTRVTGTTQSYAYFLVMPEDIMQVQPPYAALIEIGGKVLLKQSTDIYIQNLQLASVFKEVQPHDEAG